jgi:hypothetical protein
MAEYFKMHVMQRADVVNRTFTETLLEGILRDIAALRRVPLPVAAERR